MDTVFISCHPIKPQLSGGQQQKNGKEWPENETPRLPGTLYTTHISPDLFCPDNKVPAEALGLTEPRPDQLQPVAAHVMFLRDPEKQPLKPQSLSSSKRCIRSQVLRSRGASPSWHPQPGPSKRQDQLEVSFTFCSSEKKTILSPPRPSQHHVKHHPKNPSSNCKRDDKSVITNTRS